MKKITDKERRILNYFLAVLFLGLVGYLSYLIMNLWGMP